MSWLSSFFLFYNQKRSVEISAESHNEWTKGEVGEIFYFRNVVGFKMFLFV